MCLIAFNDDVHTPVDCHRRNKCNKYIAYIFVTLFRLFILFQPFITSCSSTGKNFNDQTRRETMLPRCERTHQSQPILCIVAVTYEKRDGLIITDIKQTLEIYNGRRKNIFSRVVIDSWIFAFDSRINRLHNLSKRFLHGLRLTSNS